MSADPANILSIGARLFVPEVGEILEKLLVGNDERRNESGRDRPALAIGSRQASIPASGGALNKEPPTKHFNLTQRDCSV